MNADNEQKQLAGKKLRRIERIFNECRRRISEQMAASENAGHERCHSKDDGRCLHTLERFDKD